MVYRAMVFFVSMIFFTPLNALEMARDACVQYEQTGWELAPNYITVEKIKTYANAGYAITPRLLYFALSKDNDSLVDFLLAKGANPNACPASTDHHKNPLRPIFAAQSIIMAKLLVKYGATIVSKKNDPETVFHSSLLDYGRLAYFLNLDQNTSAINDLDQEGNTPLHKIVMLLMRNEITPNYARKVVALLKRHGADIMHNNRDGYMPFNLRISVWPCLKPKIFFKCAELGNVIALLDPTREPLPTLDDDCAICLEKMSECKKSLACTHSFHPECINTWLSTSPRCPLCRAHVEESEEESGEE